MKLLLKVIILFLIIFNFRLPFVYNSCVIAVIITVLYFLFSYRSFPFTFFYQRYIVTIIIATCILGVVIMLITVLHNQYQYLLLKRVAVELFMLCCLIFALPVMIENESTAFREAIVIICCAFALQGLIHTLGFLITPMGDYLFSLQPERIQDMVMDPTRKVDKFRAYSLTGSPWFELPAAYGIACILFFRLQLDENQNFLSGWKSYVIIILMIMGIALSGRTGFIGFSIGLVLYLLFSWRDLAGIFRNIWKIAGVFLLLLGVFYVVLTPKQRESFINNLFPFAFEAFYSYSETGKFNTGSTDALLEGHYYRLRTETLLTGEGGISDDIPSYRHTDSGYMNNLIFGGIFYLLFLVVCQGLYVVPPMLLAGRYSSRQKQIDFYCFLFFYAYMFILEYKSPTLGTQHITEVLLLYAGITYIVESDALEEETGNEIYIENKPFNQDH